MRGLLALLALAPGGPVPAGRLVDALWGPVPPDHPSGALATYVGRLRRRLGGDAIATRSGGYALLTDPDDVDAVRLCRLVEDARGAGSAGDQLREESLLGQAVALWRGAPLADVGLSGARPGGTARFEECYLTAQERLADLDAATGRYERSLQVLPGLLADWPLRESLWVRLLGILHACGRRAEALERYEQARALFVRRLGTEPGAALQAVFDDLLAQPGPR